MKMFIYSGIATNTVVLLSSKEKESITWTLKVDKNMDSAIQEAVKQLGYFSKAELTREAIREFLIRHKLYNLLGEEPRILTSQQVNPDTAIERILFLFKDIPLKAIREEVEKARSEVEKEILLS